MKLLNFLGVLIAVYAVARAVAEPFVIDLADPASYAGAWGGPSLAGVLAVHCGPGVLGAMFLYGRVARYRNRRAAARAAVGRPVRP